MKLIPIKLRLSNAYLMLGERPILIDTGSPGEGKTLVKILRQHGVAVTDLSLILHTHVHSDHVGSTQALLAQAVAPVAFHQDDLPLARHGTNGKLTGVGLRGRVMAPLFANRPFDAPTADLWLTEGMRLDAYGVQGTVLHTPGHTPGSVSVLLDDGQAIVGDLLMGGYMGGILWPTKPNPHYFTADLAQNRASLQRILKLATHTLYVGHGGPLATDRVRSALTIFD
ncbi:MAG: MBL fold metallo-hydrolase [Caldilineaceae bacterium]|nr:MBL fold metallo-hydrolase [Caldilineaceae bacterium]